MKKVLIFCFAILSHFLVQSQSLGGVDLSRFVYGDNATKTNYFNDPNGLYSSGFYNTSSGTNMPYPTWWHMIINRHTNLDNNYQFQIAADFWGDNTYFRKLQDGSPTLWRRILNDGQDIYAANLNQNLRTTDNVSFNSAKAAAFLPSTADWASSGTGDGGAGIYNDNNVFKSLMIVGADRGLGKARWIRMWDNVQIESNFQVISNSIFNGNVLIGKTTQSNSNYKLDVAGNIRANKLVVNTTGADYVFDSSYSLTPLTEVEKFIQQHKHLPGIEPAKQMSEQGLDVGDNQTKLLQKIEELTLYMIEQNKRITKLEEENKKLKKTK